LGGVQHPFNDNAMMVSGKKRLALLILNFSVMCCQPFDLIGR
jgi:hypothetical protein